MKRTIILKTEAELKEARINRQNETNRKRRERYAADPEYRKKMMIKNRISHRARSGATEWPLQENLENLSNYGSERTVVIDGCSHCLQTFSVREIAEVFEYHLLAIYRWFKLKVFPRPSVLVAGATIGNAGCYVYTAEQVERLMQVMIEHQKYQLHLRRDHTETIEKLFQAVE
jgi:hypothetical protein